MKYCYIRNFRKRRRKFRVISTAKLKGRRQDSISCESPDWKANTVHPWIASWLRRRKGNQFPRPRVLLKGSSTVSTLFLGRASGCLWSFVINPSAFYKSLYCNLRTLQVLSTQLFSFSYRNNVNHNIHYTQFLLDRLFGRAKPARIAKFRRHR